MFDISVSDVIKHIILRVAVLFLLALLVLTITAVPVI